MLGVLVVEWSGLEWGGAGRNGMERNGMGWDGMGYRMEYGVSDYEWGVE